MAICNKHQSSQIFSTTKTFNIYLIIETEKQFQLCETVYLCTFLTLVLFTKKKKKLVWNKTERLRDISTQISF